VVLKPGATAMAIELTAYCKEQLACFKVPREFHFREPLSRGGIGMVLKAELREPFWQGLEERVH